MSERRQDSGETGTRPTQDTDPNESRTAATGADGATEERDAEHAAWMRELKKQQDAKVRSRRKRQGVLLVHTGDGKGKSTAAFGLALRAAGTGLRVGIVQFIKGTWKTGEQQALGRFEEIEHVVAGDGFTWNTQDRRQDMASARHGLDVARAMIEASRADEPKYQLLILDELNIALRYNYLPIRQVVELLQGRPERLHVVVTGRDARPELIEIADTVTEMRCVKHAFESGIRAQKGIEF